MKLSAETEEEAMFDDIASMPSLCRVLRTGTVAIVDDPAYGHMAPSRVEGVILGFEVEKERKDREKQDSESEE